MNLQNVDPANAEVNQAAPSRLGRRDIVLTLTGILLGVIVLTTVWASTTNGSRSVEIGVGETHQPAPHFALPGLDGTTIQLSDERGKVVLINFWGTWCERAPFGQKRKLQHSKPPTSGCVGKDWLSSALICLMANDYKDAIQTMYAGSLSSMVSPTRLRSIQPAKWQPITRLPQFQFPLWSIVQARFGLSASAN